MTEKLNKLRTPIAISTTQKVAASLGLLLLGIALGILSKVLDETPSNYLPEIVQLFDFSNFFSRMGFWLFSGITIAIYATTPWRAALNSFLFFAGMVSSYYFYTVTVAGFFPTSYVLLWVGMTILAPFLAFFCWYARGTHPLCICLAAVVLLMMTRQAFYFGFWYFDFSYPLEVLLWFATLFILYRTPKQMGIVFGIGMILFFILAPLHLFGGML